MGFFLLGLGCLAPSIADAQSSDGVREFGNIEQLSLDDLLDVETSVSTRARARTIRDAPGIVTVITREQIQRSPARDLLDLLESVPGFQMAFDVMGAGHLGVRGIWGAEGKILVLLDGHELPELMYLTTLLSNRISLDWIERIEIIRGPGSVVYGGTAELAVINVVTRGAEVLRGLSAQLELSQLSEGMLADDVSLFDSTGRANASLSIGKRFDELDGLALTLHAFAGAGQRSDRKYSDPEGQRFRLAGASGHLPAALSLGLDYQDWSLRYLLEDYRITQRDNYVESVPQALEHSFLSSSLRLGHRAELFDGFLLEPGLNYIWQKPWYTEDLDWGYDATAHRLESTLSARWAALDELDLSLGAEYSFDHGSETYTVFDDEGSPGRETTEAQYHSVASHLEALLSTEWLNVVGGLRIDWHSQFGAALSPRLSLARRFGDWHTKALFSRAFRAPSFVNLRTNPSLEPETTTAWELELGHELGGVFYVVANAFYMSISDMIVYAWDETLQAERYSNTSGLSSAGVELEARLAIDQFFASLAYSFYYPVDVQADSYQVPGEPHALLAFSPHKVNASLGFSPVEQLSVSTTATLLGPRYGLEVYTNEPSSFEQPLELLLDAKLLWRDFLTQGLRLGFSAHNLLGTKRWWIQPYDGGHPPVPGGSTELRLELGYAASFD